MSKCPFCHLNDSNKDRIIGEGQNYYLLLPKQSQTDGHCLVIPKKHSDSLISLTSQERNHLFNTTVKTANTIKNELQAKAYILRINDQVYTLNENSEHHVGHIHFHIIPLKEAGEAQQSPTIRNKSYFEEMKNKLRKFNKMLAIKE